jgi:hypothetical protein
MKVSPPKKEPTPIHIKIVSNTPGRLRLRVSHQHRQQEAIAKISNTLRSVFSGVDNIKTNVNTGSITVYYTGENGSFEDIVCKLRRLGIIISDVLPGKSEAAANLTTTMTNLNQQVHQATKGSADLRVVIPLTFGVFALRQLLSKGPGLKTAPWYVLAWYAFDSFMKLHYTSEPSPPSDRK